MEDEDAVRSVASRVLTNQGYTVLAASNGPEALSMAEKAGGRIDLVLTDVVMPDVGGPELAERLLDRWPDLRIVYMSGYAQGDKFRPGNVPSERSFLQKPFSADSLLFKVREVLDEEIVR